MIVNTDSFRALTEDVADLQRQVAELRRQQATVDAVIGPAFDAGRASITRGAGPRPAARRARHLQVVSGGQL